MGASSQSFLRESDFIEVFSEDGELEKILTKKSNGNFKAKKSQLIKMLHVRGFDRQLIINATLLQNYKLDEMKNILTEFSEYLKYQYGLEGVLELHPQDTTQNSYHFHFWTNNDNEYAYEGMKEFILGKDLANHQNVDIAGKYAKFTKGTYFDKDGIEVYDYKDNQKLKNEMIKANANVEKIEKEKIIKDIKIKHDITKILQRVNEILDNLASNRQSKNDEEISEEKKRRIENFYHGDGSDDWREQLLSIPKTDTQSRIDFLKTKLGRR